MRGVALETAAGGNWFMGGHFPGLFEIIAVMTIKTEAVAGLGQQFFVFRPVTFVTAQTFPVSMRLVPGDNFFFIVLIVTGKTQLIRRFSQNTLIMAGVNSVAV